MKSIINPTTNEYNGSGGRRNSINLPIHRLKFLYFEALQYWQTEFTGPTATQLQALLIYCNRKQLDLNLHHY